MNPTMVIGVELNVDNMPDINILDSKAESSLLTKINNIVKDPDELPLLSFDHAECIFQ